MREPLQVEGDVYALAACNDEGSRRLVEMMDEFGIANLDRLGEHIIETSRAATLEAIGKLTPGMFVEAQLAQGAAAMTVTLPVSAISYAPFGDSVFIVEDVKDPKSGKYYLYAGGSAGAGRHLVIDYDVAPAPSRRPPGRRRTSPATRRSSSTRRSPLSTAAS